MFDVIKKELSSDHPSYFKFGGQRDTSIRGQAEEAFAKATGRADDRVEEGAYEPVFDLSY